MNQRTKDKPTKSGWYWYWHDTDKYPDLPAELREPAMLMVYESEDEMYYQDTVNDLFGQKIPSTMTGFWNGPLVAPSLNAPERDAETAP